MRKLTGAVFVSLDGVMQAPGGPEEDPTSDFRFGGWVAPHWSENMGPFEKLIDSEYDLLLGKRTYDIFAAYWPYNQDIPIGATFQRINKYVLTHSDEPLEWENSHRLSGDTAEAVAELKRSEGRDLLIQGSSTLYVPLLAAGLIDRLMLMTFPVLLGDGKRIFDGSEKPGALKLVDSFVSDTGVVTTTYEPTGDVPTGSFETKPPSRAGAAREDGSGRVVTLALYGHPFSSYTWKALIALYANGTEFEFREIDQAVPKYESFTGKAHPSGQFPVLTDGDTVVVETSSIIEHLAVHHPGPAPLIPADPAAAVEARMIDRVFDHYVMGNMQRVIAAHFVDKDDPAAGGLRDEPFAPEIAAGKALLRRAYAWLERWLGANRLPPHVSLVTCAAAPSLFYADWVEPIPDDHARLKALRAELLALPEVIRCVDDARPYRPYFPYGAPDRD